MKEELSKRKKKKKKREQVEKQEKELVKKKKINKKKRKHEEKKEDESAHSEMEIQKKKRKQDEDESAHFEAETPKKKKKERKQSDSQKDNTTSEWLESNTENVNDKISLLREVVPPSQPVGQSILSPNRSSGPMKLKSTHKKVKSPVHKEKSTKKNKSKKSDYKENGKKKEGSAETAQSFEEQNATKIDSSTKKKKKKRKRTISSSNLVAPTDGEIEIENISAEENDLHFVKEDTPQNTFTKLDSTPKKQKIKENQTKETSFQDTPQKISENPDSTPKKQKKKGESKITSNLDSTSDNEIEIEEGPPKETDNSLEEEDTQSKISAKLDSTPKKHKKSETTSGLVASSSTESEKGSKKENMLNELVDRTQKKQTSNLAELRIEEISVEDNDIHSEKEVTPQDTLTKLDSIPKKLKKKRKSTITLDSTSDNEIEDPETACLARKLEENKKQAVLDERFDDAKKFKFIITELQKAGAKLACLENEKKIAVEREDYDTAKLKKNQRDELRLITYEQLNLHALLEALSTERKSLVTIVSSSSSESDTEDDLLLRRKGTLSSPLSLDLNQKKERKNSHSGSSSSSSESENEEPEEIDNCNDELFNNNSLPLKDRIAQLTNTTKVANDVGNGSNSKTDTEKGHVNKLELVYQGITNLAGLDTKAPAKHPMLLKHRTKLQDLRDNKERDNSHSSSLSLSDSEIEVVKDVGNSSNSKTNTKKCHVNKLDVVYEGVTNLADLDTKAPAKHPMLLDFFITLQKLRDNKVLFMDKTWTRFELDILQRNIKKYTDLHNMSAENFKEILYSGRGSFKVIEELANHIYRPVHAVRNKVRTLYPKQSDAEVNTAPFSKEDDATLIKLYNKFGKDWPRISQAMNRRPKVVCRRFCYIKPQVLAGCRTVERSEKITFNEQQDAKIIESIEKQKNALGVNFREENIDWSAVSVHVGDRSYNSCHRRWLNFLKYNKSKTEHDPKRKFWTVKVADILLKNRVTDFAAINWDGVFEQINDKSMPQDKICARFTEQLIYYLPKNTRQKPLNQQLQHLKQIIESLYTK